MGVKPYFVLRTNYSNYMGPHAYYKIYRKYQEISRLLPIAPPSLPVGGWRKKIGIMYEAVVKVLGRDFGVLTVLRSRNPRKDPLYRSYLETIPARRNHD